MQAFRAITTVQLRRKLILDRVPFPPGEKVEVVILGAGRSSAKRRQDWKSLFRRIQSSPAARTLSDADLQAEVEAVRGRP